MAERPLTPDEAALWTRVLETVRPIRVVKAVAKPVTKPNTKPDLAIQKPAARPKAAVVTPSIDFAAMLKAGLATPKAKTATKRVTQVAALPEQARGKMAATLDGSWDRQLSRGHIAPDRAIDLHGHNLSTAYATLDQALDRSIRDGDRVVLLVTGKPPRPESERPHARGAIRAAVGDWLAGSRHAAAIAAVRGAHPRHGGTGALYIILRRATAPRKY